MRGPIDFIVVGFPGNNFKGEILRELKSAIANQTIALLDLSVISKGAGGSVTSIELSAANDAILRELKTSRPDTGRLISEEDIAEVGELLDNDSSAGLLVIEHLWAKGLKQAIIDADGVLLAEGRIHPEADAEINQTETNRKVEV